MSQVVDADLHSLLLSKLNDRRVDRRLGGGRHYIHEAVRESIPVGQQPSRDRVMAAVWGLVAQGLAYLDYSQPAPENWEVRLTPAGIAAAEDTSYDAGNAGAYLTRLRKNAPVVSETVWMYVEEAVKAFNGRCYLSSTVMVGVASEAAFLEMAASFPKWLPGSQGTDFFQVLENPRKKLAAKFSDFRKRLEPLKPKLPEHLSENMTLTLDAVLDLLRANRNDVGHPTGRFIDRDEAKVNLEMFARYLGKLYDLKALFDEASQ